MIDYLTQPLPLGLYLLLWLVVTLVLIFAGIAYHRETKKREQVEDQLQQTDAELLAAESENQELSQGYSSMALLIEEMHQQMSDLHVHSDSLEQRIDRLEQRKFQIYLAFQHNNQTDASDDESEPYLFPEWIEDVKGIDEL